MAQANAPDASGRYFVSFKDMALEARQRPHLSVLPPSHRSLLAAGSGIDSSADVYHQYTYRNETLSSADGAPPRKEGWLQKEGHGGMLASQGKILGGLVGSNWTQRYMVLADGFLEYFEAPEFSPKPWGTHQTAQAWTRRAGGTTAHLSPLDSISDDFLLPSDMNEHVHVTNAKGHICLARASVSAPKSTRKDEHGNTRFAWRIDCATATVDAYNHLHKGKLLLNAAANESAVAHKAEAALSSSRRLSLGAASSKSSSVKDVDGANASANASGDGFVTQMKRRLSSSYAGMPQPHPPDTQPCPPDTPFSPSHVA